jgi:hypothetical protein
MLHHENRKIPCKMALHHANKKTAFPSGHGFGRVTQSSGCRIGKVR